MRKRTPKIVSVILLVMLCLSLLPVVAMAEGSGSSVPAETSEAPASCTASDPAPASISEPASSAPESTPEPSPEPDSAPASEPASASAPEPGVESVSEPPPESDPEPVPEPAREPDSEAHALAGIEAEMYRVTDKPLIRVEYHYYDDTQPAATADFTGHVVLSSHAFYARAFATEDDTSITIAANKYPGTVPVSTDASQMGAASAFRVLLDGDTDITALAAYDAASGLVTLPAACTGHAIDIAFACPVSEVAELPVNITTSIYQNGVFSDTTAQYILASNANTISIPLAQTNGVVVAQNGVALAESTYSVTDSVLTINAPALGGDISIAAYALRPRTRAGGQVAHVLYPDKIYYGTFFTTYFTGNGNTAFCLHPLLYSPGSGTYDISRYLQPGADDLLIKCAYYYFERKQ